MLSLFLQPFILGEAISNADYYTFDQDIGINGHEK